MLGSHFQEVMRHQTYAVFGRQVYRMLVRYLLGYAIPDSLFIFF